MHHVLILAIDCNNGNRMISNPINVCPIISLRVLKRIENLAHQFQEIVLSVDDSVWHAAFPNHLLVKIRLNKAHVKSVPA